MLFNDWIRPLMTLGRGSLTSCTDTESPTSETSPIQRNNIPALQLLHKYKTVHSSQWTGEQIRHCLIGNQGLAEYIPNNIYNSRLDLSGGLDLSGPTVLED